MKSAWCRTLCLVFLTHQFSATVEAYGPLGHEIVGAIADERLANTPTATKVRALLDGLTLEKAGVIADEIKGWDKKGVDDPRSFHYSAHRDIDKQLRDFWRANPPTLGMNPGVPYIIGSIIPTFPSCPTKDTATDTPAAANGM
jgi:hypothetical protein